MKHNYQSRYADLLDDTNDTALNTLVEKLDSAYTAPARPEGLSWTNAQRQIAPPHLQPVTPLMQTPRRQRGRNFALLAIAAVVAITLLSGTLLSLANMSIIGGRYPSTSTKSPMNALLVSLLQDKGTPKNIDQLVQSGRFTNVDVTSSLYDVHIEKVYADANNVVLLYTMDQQAWNKSWACNQEPCKSEPALLLKTSTGQTLVETIERANMGKQPVSDNKLVAVLAYYDASVIQGAPTELTLTASLSSKLSSTNQEVGKVVVPVDAFKKTLTLKQTVSADGHQLTLDRAVVTPSETRFYYSSDSSLESAGDTLVLFSDETLAIGGRIYSPNPLPVNGPGNTYGWFDTGANNGKYTSYHEDLRDMQGNWTLTERAVKSEQSSGKDTHYQWVFTFSVS